MLPYGQVMPWRQDADSPLALGAGPSARLRAVFRAGREEVIDAGVVHLHLVVFIYVGKCCAARGQRMTLFRFDRHGTLGWMAGKDAAHEVAQRRYVIVESGP